MKLKFYLPRYIIPYNINKSIISIIRDIEKKCIYDSGDYGYFCNSGYLKGEFDTECDNYTIWSCFNEFYILVVGISGYSCSDCCHCQYHDCKVYISDTLSMLIEYSMTEKQRSDCKEIWCE